FDPVDPEDVPEAAQGGLNDALGSLLGPNGALGSRNTTGFGLNVAYRMKELNATGKGKLSFNGRATIERHHYVTFNIGNLYQRFGTNPAFFRDVALYDPSFQQREVFVGIDGSLEKEFDKMINSVTLTIRKQHENGQETLKEILINREGMQKFEKPVSVAYLNQGDENRLNWLEYEYRQTWNFVGEGAYTTPWQRENGSMVNVFTPYRRRRIDLEGDIQSLAAKGVRAVTIQISYNFFGRPRQERLTFRPSDDLSGKGFEVTLPLDQDAVSYTITWIKADGSKVSQEGSDNLGLIFLDEMPQP
ncbi:MAG: hypothetical protein EAZ89_01810, partial [Bacteroidetes bacterium]